MLYKLCTLDLLRNLRDLLINIDSRLIKALVLIYSLFHFIFCFSKVVSVTIYVLFYDIESNKLIERVFKTYVLKTYSFKIKKLIVLSNVNYAERNIIHALRILHRNLRSVFIKLKMVPV